MSLPRQRAVRIGTALLATASAALLAACGTSASGSTNATGASGTTNTPAIQAAVKNIAGLQKPITNWPGISTINNPMSLAGKNIMIVPLTDSVAILHGMALGAQQALRHLGANVTICDGKASPTTVATCLQQAQSQKDFAVITNFVAYPMDANAFNALAGSGTKVVIAGDTPVAGQSYDPNIQFFDSSASLMKLSADEADAAVADKGTNANVLSLALSDTANQAAQAAEVKREFQQDCPTCGFVESKFSTPDADKLPSAVSAMLVSHPNTNVIILPVDTFVPLAVQGASSTGNLNKVEFISTGSDVAGLQRVKASQEAHDFGAPSVYDGYALANALMQEASGEKVTPAANVTRDFTKSNVGGLKLTDTQYYTSDWFGNDSFEAAFYKAWGSK